MTRLSLCSVMVVVLAIGGCKSTEKQPEPSQAADVGALQPDYYAADYSADDDAPRDDTPSNAAVGGGTDADVFDMTAAEPQAPAAPYAAYDEPAGTAAGITHVVQRGDTLYGLARRYYSDQSRWKDIYRANDGILSDPNKLRVGQRLVIP